MTFAPSFIIMDAAAKGMWTNMVFWNNLGWYEVEPRSQHAVRAQPLFCLRVHSVPLVFLKSNLAVSVEGLPLSNVSVLFQTHLPNIKVHAYFAPVTPPPSVGGSRQRFCRCCIILWQWRWSTLVNWVFNDTSRVTVDLHWKQPQCSGQRLQSEGGVQIPRATHNTHTHSHPDPVCLCDQGTEFVLALSCGLVKLNHSCWMCPEENHKQGRWKGAFQQTQFYCYCGFFILLRGFFGNFGTATAVLQGQGKHRKTIHVVSGTRGKISLHPINGSHPLWDD